MMPECNCSLRIKLVGDGCQICNPGFYKQMLQDYYDEVRYEFRADIMMDIYHEVDYLPHEWDMVVEYFTHI